MPVGGIVSALSKYQQRGGKLGGGSAFLYDSFSTCQRHRVLKARGRRGILCRCVGGCAPVPPGVSRDPLSQNALRAEVGFGELLIGWGGLGEWFTSILPCPSGEEGKATHEAGKPNTQILFFFYFF